MDQGWRLAPHRFLRRLCHFLALDDRWGKDACHEFGLRYLLSQGNHFRHFLEELVPWEATLVSWLLHTHPTSYAFNGSAKCRPAVRHILGANEAFPCFQPSVTKFAMAGVATKATLSYVGGYHSLI